MKYSVCRFLFSSERRNKQFIQMYESCHGYFNYWVARKFISQCPKYEKAKFKYVNLFIIPVFP